MGVHRVAPAAGIEPTPARELRPRPRRLDDTIVPASSLSAMPLAWAVGPVAPPPQRSVTKTSKSAEPSPECVFCMKGAATALGFRPAYWTYERQPAEVSSPPTRQRSAKIKARRSSS